MKKIYWTCLLVLGIFVLTGFKVQADNIVVVIDPGHGGSNLGAEIDGRIEKDMNLKVAKAMYKHLSLYEGVDVYLTHEEDEGLTLKKRAEIAESLGADYLISLHFNAAEYHQFYGTECWVPYDDFYEEAYEAAAYFQDELVGIGLYNRGIKTRLNEEGDNYYGIIREAERLDIPCVLVEHCHLDNKNDAGYYETDEKLEKLGELDAQAMAKFLGLKSKRFGVDYSDYSLDVTIPLSENTRDKTGPSNCVLTVKEYNQETGEVTLILTAREDESRLLYYDYSFDGGVTFSERFSLLYEKVEFSFVMEDGITPKLIARAYSLNDASTESNQIVLEPVTYPVEDAVNQMSLQEMEREKNRQRFRTFLIASVCIIILCFMIVSTFYVVKSIQRSKKRKRKLQELKRRQMLK